MGGAFTRASRYSVYYSVYLINSTKLPVLTLEDLQGEQERARILCAGMLVRFLRLGTQILKGGGGGAEGGVEVGQRSGRRWRRSCLPCELPLSTLSRSEGTCPRLTAIQQAFIERCYSLNTAFMEP